jgi:F-type H+-transporting ATPase subunit c
MEIFGTLSSVMMAAQIAAAIAVLAAAFTAIGQGYIAAKTIESVARQPECRSNVTSTMFIGLAMAETGGIYGLLIAIILIFANPFVSQFISLMP